MDSKKEGSESSQLCGEACHCTQGQLYREQSNQAQDSQIQGRSVQAPVQVNPESPVQANPSLANPVQDSQVRGNQAQSSQNQNSQGQNSQGQANQGQGTQFWASEGLAKHVVPSQGPEDVPKEIPAPPCEGTDADFSLASYDFYLPEEQIAQHPALQRGTSRLLVVHRNTEPLRLEAKQFTDIVDVLPENCLLVANNSRVVPARLMGKRASGGKVEFLLLSPLPLLTPHLLSAEENRRYGATASRFASQPNTPDGSRLSSPLSGQPRSLNHLAGTSSEQETALEDEWLWAEAQGLLRSSKQVKVGEVLQFSADLRIEMLERHDFGRSRVRLVWRGDLHAILDREGSLPLPPYIKRPRTDEGTLSGASGQWGNDGERYQTVYSNENKAGSVAAPTAGLHFTPALRERVVASGREWVEATLYVGYGTFSPVREDDIRQHVMHAEYVELSAEAAAAINKAKSEGRPVIPIGTTSVRILEGVYRALHGSKGIGSTDDRGGIYGADGEKNIADQGEVGEQTLVEGEAFGGKELAAYSGWVNLFLYPGQPFYIADGLVTNFHLPGSSLLMLVSAFAGRRNILEAYAYAVEHGFKFFSYGDSMFIY